MDPRSAYIIRPQTTRPLLKLNMTGDGLLRKRFQECTTPLALTAALILPAMMALHSRAEKRIDAKESGVVYPKSVQEDVQESAVFGIANFLKVSTSVSIHSLLCRALLNSTSAAAQATAHAYDYAPRITCEYVGRILNAVYLPPKWATLLGFPASKEDIEHFETPNLSPIAVCQDAIRRSCLYVAADFGTTVITMIFRKLTWKPFLSKLEKPYPGEKFADPPSWSTLAHNAGCFALLGVLRLVGEGLGATIGSAISPNRGGGMHEYVGSLVGGMLARHALYFIYTPGYLVIRGQQPPSDDDNKLKSGPQGQM